MGIFCCQVVGLLLAIVSLSEAGNNIAIHLFPGGVVAESTIKSSLLNAFNRYFRGKKTARISFFLGSTRIIDHQLPNQEFVDKIGNLTFFKKRQSCSQWFMDQLESGADNYILTDLNPCDPEETVNKARRFVSKNRRTSSIYPIGMGNQIHSEWLQKTCGPCSSSIGCLKGFNWFRV